MLIRADEIEKERENLREIAHVPSIGLHMRALSARTCSSCLLAHACRVGLHMRVLMACTCVHLLL